MTIYLPQSIKSIALCEQITATPVLVELCVKVKIIVLEGSLFHRCNSWLECLSYIDLYWLFIMSETVALTLHHLDKHRIVNPNPHLVNSLSV